MASNPQEIFDSWFNHLQALHASNPNRHENQASYDATLKDNYPFIFWNLGQTDVPLVCHDIGCAYGTMSLGAYSLGYRTIAVDCIDTWVNRPALEQRGIEVLIHDIEKGPVPGPKADVVIFTEVLEHLNTNPINALLNVRESMLPGAKLILSTPRREMGKHTGGLYQADCVESSNTPNVEGLPVYSDWRDIPIEVERPWIDAHMYVYTERELYDLLNVTGFRVLTTSVFWNGLSRGVIATKSWCEDHHQRYYAKDTIEQWQRQTD